MENAGFENDSHMELFMNIRTKLEYFQLINLNPIIIFVPSFIFSYSLLINFILLATFWSF